MRLCVKPGNARSSTDGRFYSLICDSAIPVEFAPTVVLGCGQSVSSQEKHPPDGQLRLEFRFPGTAASAIAATRVDQDEELPGAWIADRAFLVPPIRNGVQRKGGSVCETPTMTKSARHRTLIRRRPVER